MNPAPEPRRAELGKSVALTISGPFWISWSRGRPGDLGLFSLGCKWVDHLSILLTRLIARGRTHRPLVRYVGAAVFLRVDEDLGGLCAVLDAVGGEAELHVLVTGSRGELDGDRVPGVGGGSHQRGEGAAVGGAEDGQCLGPGRPGR